jgi:hypothetical protein
MMPDAIASVQEILSGDAARLHLADARNNRDCGTASPSRRHSLNICRHSVFGTH